MLPERTPSGWLVPWCDTCVREVGRFKRYWHTIIGHSVTHAGLSLEGRKREQEDVKARPSGKSNPRKHSPYWEGRI